MQGNRDAELAGLLRAAVGGDEKAYARFLEAAAKLIRAVVRRRAGQGAIDLEDIVQETLLAIHLKRHTWRTDAPVLPWLSVIARHKLVDAWRRKGRRIELDIGDFTDTLAANEDDDSASARDIERALNALPQGQRDVVQAISVDGRSIGETASGLGMSEGAVRVALHRGLKAIATRFGQS